MDEDGYLIKLYSKKFIYKLSLHPRLPYGPFFLFFNNKIKEMQRRRGGEERGEGERERREQKRTEENRREQKRTEQNRREQKRREDKRRE